MDKDEKVFWKVIIFLLLTLVVSISSCVYFENKKSSALKSWSEYKCNDLAKSYGLKNVDIKCLTYVNLGYAICSINSDKKMLTLKCFKNDDVCMLQSSVDLK